MRALGIDLGWVDGHLANETGVVAVDEDGSILDAGWTIGVDSTLTWARAHESDSTLIFVDAPLLVLNDVGQRLCEKQVGERYGRWKVSANSTNTTSPRLAGTVLRAKLEEAGWAYRDGTAGPDVSGLTLSECYPYTTTVGAVELGYAVERPLYKRKPRGLSTAGWRVVRAARCDVLIERIAGLTEAFPRLDLRSHLVTAELVDSPSPVSDRAYKHREDLLDACLAAWTALVWAKSGLERCQVLGARDPLVDGLGRRATIIAPARPEQRRDDCATGPFSEPPELWPRRGERLAPRDGYLEIEIPEQFTLEIRDRNRGPWHPWAALRADWFGRNDDGTYVCTAHGGSPVYIRALSVDPSGVIEHVDGDGYGQVHGYRLVPFEDERLVPG